MKIKGGEFIIKETEARDVFVPEEFDEEQLMIKKNLRRFFTDRNISQAGGNRSAKRRLDAGTYG